MSKSYDRLAEVKAIVLEAFKAGKPDDINRIATMVNDKDIDVNTPLDADGRTCLMLAADGGHIRLVKYLVEKQKADLHLKDKKGNTALQFAVNKSGKFKRLSAPQGSRDLVVPVQNYVNIFEFLYIRGARYDKKCEHIPVYIQNLETSYITDRNSDKCYKAQSAVLEKFKDANQTEEAIKWFQQLAKPGISQEWYVDTLVSRGELKEATDYFHQKVRQSRASLHDYHCKFAAAAKTHRQLKDSLAKLREIDFDDLKLKNVYLFSEVKIQDFPANRPFALRFLKQLKKSTCKASKNILEKYCNYGSFEIRQIASYFCAQEEKQAAREEDYFLGLQALYALNQHLKPDAQYAKKIFHNIIEAKPTTQKLAYAKLRFAASCCVIAESSTALQQQELEEAINTYDEIINKPELYNQLDFFARAEIHAQLVAIKHIHLTTKLRACILKQFAAERQLKEPCQDLLESFEFSIKDENEQEIVQWRDNLLRGANPSYLYLTEQQRKEIIKSVSENEIIKNHHREIFFDLYQLELKSHTSNDLMLQTFNLLMDQKILEDMKCWDHVLSLISESINSVQYKYIINVLVQQLEQLQTYVVEDPVRSAQVKRLLFVGYQKIDSPKAFEVADEKEVKASDLCALHVRIAQQSSESKAALEHYQAAAKLGDENAAFAAAKLLLKEHKDQPSNAYPTYQLAVNLALQNKNEKLLQEILEDAYPVAKEFRTEQFANGWDIMLVGVINSKQISPENLFDLLRSLHKKGVNFSSDVFDALREKLFVGHVGYANNLPFIELCLKLGVDKPEMLQSKWASQLNSAKKDIELLLKKFDKSIQREGEPLFKLYNFPSDYYYQPTLYRYKLDKYVKLEVDFINSWLFNSDDLKHRIYGMFDTLAFPRPPYGYSADSYKSYWVDVLKNVIPPIICALKARVNDKNKYDDIALLLSLYDRLIKSEKSEQITGKTEAQIYTERAEVEIQLAARPEFFKDKSKSEELFKKNLSLLKHPKSEIRKIARETLNDLCRIATRHGQLELAARANYLPAIVKLALELCSKIPADPNYQTKMNYYVAACHLFLKAKEAVCAHFGIARAEMRSFKFLELKYCSHEGYSRKLSETNPQDLRRILNPAATLFDRSCSSVALGIKAEDLDQWKDLCSYDASTITSVVEGRDDAPKPEIVKPSQPEFLFLDTLSALEHKDEAHDELSTHAEPAYIKKEPSAPSSPAEGMPVVVLASAPVLPSAPLAEITDEGKERPVAQPIEELIKGSEKQSADGKAEEKAVEIQQQQERVVTPAPSFDLPVLDTKQLKKLKGVPSDALVYSVLSASTPKQSAVEVVERNKLEDKNKQEPELKQKEGVFSPITEIEVEQGQGELATEEETELELGEVEIIAADLEREGLPDQKSQPLPQLAAPPQERKRPLPVSGSVVAELPASQSSVAERGPISVSIQTPEGTVSINVASGNPVFVEAMLTSLVQAIARFPQQQSAVPASRVGVFGGSVVAVQSAQENESSKMNLAG